MAHTDLDALERLLGTVVSGDLESEDFRRLTPGNVNRLFRAAQLVVEYLLYVQELLAAENGMVKVRGPVSVHGRVKVFSFSSETATKGKFSKSCCMDTIAMNCSGCQPVTAMPLCM